MIAVLVTVTMPFTRPLTPLCLGGPTSLMLKKDKPRDNKALVDEACAYSVTL